jgi:hypothetical protein
VFSSMGGNLEGARPVGFLVTAPDMSTRAVSCAEVLALIQCYLDCECDAVDMVVIACHLDRCPGCARELLELRWIKAAVRRCAGAPESRL